LTKDKTFVYNTAQAFITVCNKALKKGHHLSETLPTRKEAVTRNALLLRRDPLQLSIKIEETNRTLNSMSIVLQDEAFTHLATQMREILKDRLFSAREEELKSIKERWESPKICEEYDATL